MSSGVTFASVVEVVEVVAVPPPSHPSVLSRPSSVPDQAALRRQSVPAARREPLPRTTGVFRAPWMRQLRRRMPHRPARRAQEAFPFPGQPLTECSLGGKALFVYLAHPPRCCDEAAGMDTGWTDRSRPERGMRRSAAATPPRCDWLDWHTTTAWSAPPVPGQVRHPWVAASAPLMTCLSGRG